MSAKARNVDFSGVKDGGNSKITKKRFPAGDYLGKIISVEDADKDDAAMYLFVIQLVKHPSGGYPYYCKIQDNQLWKLRNLFIAAGKNVPKTKQKVDPNVIVGKTIGVSIDDTEYKDQEQSEITGVFPAADLADGDDDDDIAEDEEGEEEEELDLEAADDEAEDEAEEEAEDEETDDGYDGMDRNELKSAIRESDPTFQARKSQTNDDLRAILRAGIADTDEEEEEEEVPEPPKKILKKPAPATVKKAPIKKKSIDEVTDEELEELDIDEL